MSLFSIKNFYGFINIYIFAELYIFFSKDSDFFIHINLGEDELSIYYLIGEKPIIRKMF